MFSTRRDQPLSHPRGCPHIDRTRVEHTDQKVGAHDRTIGLRMVNILSTRRQHMFVVRGFARGHIPRDIMRIKQPSAREGHAWLPWLMTFTLRAGGFACLDTWCLAVDSVSHVWRKWNLTRWCHLWTSLSSHVWFQCISRNYIVPRFTLPSSIHNLESNKILVTGTKM